jgi:hypothetical protein
MESAQCRTIAYTEYCRSSEPLAHQLIEARLRSLIHHSGRFVEEEPIELLDQRSSEGDALLLAGRELERPMANLVESFGQVTESQGPHRIAQF